MSFPWYLLKKPSILQGYVRLKGNECLIESIEAQARSCISAGRDLYDAQVCIKELLVQEFGEDWYLKSGDAVNYIIENEYSVDFYNKTP